MNETRFSSLGEFVISLSQKIQMKFLHVCSDNSYKYSDFSDGEWTETHLLRKVVVVVKISTY